MNRLHDHSKKRQVELARENPKYIRADDATIGNSIPCKGKSKEKALGTSDARGVDYI